MAKRVVPRITKCLACARHTAGPQDAPLWFLNAEWAEALLPWLTAPSEPEAEGPTPRRSCPPGDASCAWRWPRPPPARTAASPSPTPSAGPRPGAQAAGPPAAGPGPVRATRGDIRRGSVGTEGMVGMGRGPRRDSPAVSSSSHSADSPNACSCVHLGCSPARPGDHRDGVSTEKPPR